MNSWDQALQMDLWDLRFLKLANQIGSWSKDPSTKVGAVIVRPDRTIASVGYNGFPRNVDDSPEQLADKATKYEIIIHAEVNAVLSARERLDGYTIYVTPLHPCSRCASIIVQSGIKRVVAYMPEYSDHWKTSFSLAKQSFEQAKVDVDIYHQLD